MIVKNYVKILKENFNEYKKQILMGVAAGALLMAFLTIAAQILGTPTPTIFPIIIIMFMAGIVRETDKILIKSFNFLGAGY